MVALHTFHDTNRLCLFLALANAQGTTLHSPEQAWKIAHVDEDWNIQYDGVKTTKRKKDVTIAGKS